MNILSLMPKNELFFLKEIHLRCERACNAVDFSTEKCEKSYKD